MARGGASRWKTGAFRSGGESDWLRTAAAAAAAAVAKGSILDEEWQMAPDVCRRCNRGASPELATPMATGLEERIAGDVGDR